MPKTTRRFTLRDAFLEFIHHSSPLFLVALCLSCWIFRGIDGKALPWREWGAIAGILLYWPFQEWWMHRVLLHLPPLRIGGRSYELDFAKKHRLHHADPTFLPLIFLPLPTVVVSLVLFTSIAGVISGWDPSFILVFMGTASFSTLLYEWTHYLTHSRYLPQTAFFRRIWKQHRWHHYKNEKYWYSFTIPQIDGWMGTGPEVHSVPKSSTARNLGRTPDGELLSSD